MCVCVFVSTVYLGATIGLSTAASIRNSPTADILVMYLSQLLYYIGCWEMRERGANTCRELC